MGSWVAIVDGDGSRAGVNCGHKSIYVSEDLAQIY